MKTTTRLAALTGCATLLISGLATTPAGAEDVPVPTAVNLTVAYAGKAAESVTLTDVATVADVITALSLKVDGNDRVTPATDTAVVDGLAITVDVVSTKTFTKKNVTLKKKTVYTKTKKLYKGDRKVVTNGRNGKATRIYRTTTVNGRSTTTLIKQKVTKKVVNRKVLVGANSKRAINLARYSKWIKIARCESGLRWHINTGNGYYGGLQFGRPAWREAKGYHFAKLPHQATKNEQITVANRLYAKRGFQPWSCRRVL